jgi:endogenous inhibitor of DNA gyrase (YacG/DUF329 family)
MSQENKMTHCPKCGKPVLNSGQFWGNAQFTIKCPWCQTVVSVCVQQQITAKLKQAEPIGGYVGQAEFSQSRAQDDSGFDSPAPHRQSGSVGEDGFKVVGYIYPQGDSKPPG